MSGRGKILDIKLENPKLVPESSTNPGNSNNDSGFLSKSHLLNVECRRLGRGKFLEDLTQQCSNITINCGRGRADLLRNVGTVKHVNENVGRGRANFLQSFVSSDLSSTKIAKESASNSLPKQEVEMNKSTEKYFKPLITQGTKGNRVQLCSNYLRLYSNPEKGVFLYEVRFNPTIDSPKLRIHYLNEHRQKFGGIKTFDGVTLYLPILLPEKLTTYISKCHDGSEVEIRILFKRKECLKNCLHLYNVLFGRIMKTLNYVQFEKKYFDPSSPKIIPQAKLEVWPGYVTAVDEFEGGLLLCCDISHRLLCQKTVLETLLEIYHNNPQQFEDNAKKTLLGLVVITRYNNKTYRIDDICFNKNPLSTFKIRGEDIRFTEYYLKNHNVAIIDEKQPLLLSIKSQRATGGGQDTQDIITCLIPELCYLTGLRDDIRSDAKLMREIASFTRVSPQQRIVGLEKFCNNINNCMEAQKILNDWGLSLNQSKETITGRLLDMESIIFGNKVFCAGMEADFSKYSTRNTLLEVVPLINWLLIHCKKDSKVASSLVNHLDQSAYAMGMIVAKPRVVVLHNDRVEYFVQSLRTNITKDTSMVVCISPTNRDDIYSAIKKICCAEIPVPSQVIISKTLFNETKNRSIVQKIALQLNCKLGGSLWSIKIPFKNVMICGIDSYHDASQKDNSVGAFVASLNVKYSQWYSKAVMQTKKEEIVSTLCSSLISALRAYQKQNQIFPEQVIIYRDGVGDGQLSLCTNYEIPQLEGACQKQAIPVKITYIIVQKRINTRYFMMTRNEPQNPAPGTIIDTTITRPNMYDFFLVSQSVRQGTVSPSHYIVLQDDNNFSPDILQRLTYKLCFMYYNWPGTIRVPACCQYAHKLAYLVGQNIRRTPAEELANKLFYL